MDSIFCNNMLFSFIFAIGCVKVKHWNIIKKFYAIFFTFVNILLKNKKNINYESS